MAYPTNTGLWLADITIAEILSSSWNPLRIEPTLEIASSGGWRKWSDKGYMEKSLFEVHFAEPGVRKPRRLDLGPLQQRNWTHRDSDKCDKGALSSKKELRRGCEVQQTDGIQALLADFEALWKNVTRGRKWNGYSTMVLGYFQWYSGTVTDLLTLFKLVSYKRDLP